MLSLFANSGTLVFCALPALLVALGAGAALSSLVSVFPQIVWLSEHQEALFAFAGPALAASGGLLWLNRTAPCPTDPVLRQAVTTPERAHSKRRLQWVDRKRRYALAQARRDGSAGMASLDGCQSHTGVEGALTWRCRPQSSMPAGTTKSNGAELPQSVSVAHASTLAAPRL